MIRPAILALALGAGGQDALSEGQKAFERGDFARAEALFRQQLKIQPNSAEAMSNLAAIHSRRGEFAEAVALYQKALSVNRGLVEIHFNLAVARLRSSDYRGAARSLRVFLKSHPGEPRARELLGICLVESGELSAAIAELEAVLGEKPGDASALFSLAYAHARGGDAGRGQALIARLESHPAQARLVEGLIEYRRERFPEAKRKFEEALRHDPRSAPALSALGRMLLHESQDEPALKHLEKARDLAPHDAEVCYLLGVVYDRNGRTAEARQMFRRALPLRARYAGPLYGLARIELRENRPAAAVKLLEEAASYAAAVDAVHLLLGRAYQAAGQPEKARSSFAEVRRLQQARLQKQQADLESGLILEPEPARQP